MKAGELMRFTKMTGDVIRAMRECPIPIIVKIQGIAAGAGSVIALAADFRVVGTVRALRVPVHQGRAVRRRHGSGVPPAARRRAGPGHLAAHARRHDRRGDRRPLRPGLPAGRRRRARRRRRGPRRAGSPTGPTLALPQTKSLLTRELDMSIVVVHGARRDDPGTADDHRRPRRVPRGVQRQSRPSPTWRRAGERLADRPGDGCLEGHRRRVCASRCRRPVTGSLSSPATRKRCRRWRARCPASPSSSPRTCSTRPPSTPPFARVEEEWGPVEILVVNAGAALSAPLVRTSDEDWQRMLDLNLTAPFRCLRRALSRDASSRSTAASW